MAKLSHPTELEIPAPLLIEQIHLTALDAVLDQYTDRLREEQTKQIHGRIERAVGQLPDDKEPENKSRQKAESLIRAEYERERRGVALYLSGGRTLTANRFEEAINQPHLMRELPVGFRCDLEVGEIETSITLRSRWNTGIDITVRPSSSVAAQELYGALENWASDVRPPNWQRIWLGAVMWARFLLLFWVLLGLPFMFVGLELDAKDLYAQEAKQLLQQGINSSNQQKGIELILSIVSGAGPKSALWRPGVTGWGYWVAGLLVLLALSACPKAVIGIWRGKQRLKFWNLWIRTVWVSVPVLVITTVIWPRFLSMLGIH